MHVFLVFMVKKISKYVYNNIVLLFYLSISINNNNELSRNLFKPCEYETVHKQFAT